MKAPVAYIPKFVPDPDVAFRALRNELDWERRPDAPRFEFYCNDFPAPYTYGRRAGQRTYHPRPMHPAALAIRQRLEAHAGCVFEVCFLNFYRDGKDQLGWHADDSPEMDDARPIAVVTLLDGVGRDILFRPNGGGPESVERLRLGHGSLCLMAPGMQDSHQHRIPKAGYVCGERISLTFRGYAFPPGAIPRFKPGESQGESTDASDLFDL